ncbi:RluA family pseudouridine synthase [soil metagenome]
MARPEPGWAPPPRDGVSASRVGVGSAHFGSVLDFLTARFPAVGNWPERLARGDVLDAMGQALAPNAPCVPGMLIWYWRSPPPEHPVPFEIELLHQDEHLVVVDKPHFLPVTPGGRHLHETVLVRLKRQLGIATLAPMHRLDRDTAGVLVFTVQPATRNAYHALLRGHEVHKVYEAIAPWRADLPLPLTCRHRLEEPQGAAFMQMQVVAGEPNAETLVESIEVIGPSDTWARYRLTPRTGRRHQLRAQMNALGLPIVGDRIYPRLWPDLPPGRTPDYSQPLQLLAREFSFVDPLSGVRRCFTSRRELRLPQPE